MTGPRAKAGSATLPVTTTCAPCDKASAIALAPKYTLAAIGSPAETANSTSPSQTSSLERSTEFKISSP